MVHRRSYFHFYIKEEDFGMSGKCIIFGSYNKVRWVSNYFMGYHLNIGDFSKFNL